MIRNTPRLQAMKFGPFGTGTSLLTMVVVNHLLTEMILQVNRQVILSFCEWEEMPNAGFFSGKCQPLATS